MLIVDAIKFRSNLVNIARKMVGDAAEDVVQDLMEYLLRTRMNTAPTPERLLTWYIKNRCIQHIRGKNRRQKYELNVGEGITIYPDRFEPGEDGAGEEEIMKVYTRLDQIDSFAKMLFLLVVVEGYNIVEISESTGIKADKLRHIYRQTKKELNEIRGQS